MMYYRISKNEKNLFSGKKIAEVWAVTLTIAISLSEIFGQKEEISILESVALLLCISKLPFVGMKYMLAC